MRRHTGAPARSLRKHLGDRGRKCEIDQGVPGWDLEHAAIVETSLMLALRPELVRSDKTADDGPEEHPWYDLLPEPSSHVPTSGVLPRASSASREKGERLRDLLVARLIEALAKEFNLAE